MKRMFRVVLAFVVVAWGLTLPAMETVSAQVATITPTATDTNPLAGKEAAWTRRVTVGQNENVDVSVYKDFAYGTRGDASDEGSGYSLHNWIMDDARGGGAFHRHRSGQYFDVFKPSNMTPTSPVLIYLHGGSWSQCYDKDGTSLDMLASIAAKGYVVITADYILQNDITEGGATTLREGATFTAMLQDIDTLVSYLTRFLPAMGVTPTKLAIGGVSAGGHLSSLYAYDQAMPERLGLNLAHAIPVAVELDLVGPTDLGNLTENISLEAMRQLYGENAELVLAMFTALFEGVTGTTTLEAAAEQMELFSPLALVCAQSPATIAAYCELTDANGNGTGTDGAVRVSDFHGLTNALAAAGVNCKASLTMGVAHGELDNPSVLSNSVEWIVASMDQALKAGWYDVADENQDPDDPPPSVGLKMADFAKKFTVALPADFSGTLTGFPLLVRISPARISGFTYADIKQAGADFAAVDAEGNFLPTELQRYDATGESLLWVKVPEAKAGSTVTILYGTEQSVASLPQATALWSDYAGVWHMDEDSGTVVKDSAGVQDGVANAKSSVVESAILGGGRTMGTTSAKNGACVTVARTDRLDEIDSTFTVSGWVKLNAAANWGYFFGRKTSDAYPSWGVQCGGNNGVSDLLRIWSNGNSDSDAQRSKITTTGLFPLGTWVKYEFVYTPTTVTLYVNGAQVGNPVSAFPGPAANGANGFGIGGFPTTENHATLPAQHDEIKLCARAVDADWAKAEYEQEKGTLALVYGEAMVTDESAPVIDAVSARVAADGTVTVSVAVSEGEGTIGVAYNGDEATAKTLGTISAVPATFTDSPAIPAGAIWSVTAWGLSPAGTQVVKTMAGGVMNAAVTVEKTQDADENGLKPGVFVLTRPATATALPLVVNLVWTSDGEAGVDYVADLPSVVTIPAGETSTVLTVTPIMNGDKKTDTAVSVTVAPGAYISGATADLTIKNLEVDADFNTWVAAPESDGLASTAANWSMGVPQAGQRILFDGRFSTKDCMWDGGVNGLTASVASWKQSSDYTGTVTFMTTYEEASTTFVRMTIAGDVELLGGKWTHPSNETAVATYHLDVSVGGDFTLAKGTAIDCRYRGFGAKRTYAGGAIGAHGGSSSDWTHARDSVYLPKEIGSSGNANAVYAGGGAVWLSVGGAMTMDGDIDVHSAENTSGWGGPGSGAPGAVYLSAKSLTGAGTIHAEAPVVDRRGAVTASGGRVAIYLTEATELGITLDQIPHYGAISGNCAGAGTVFVKVKGDTYGTLYIVNTKKTMSHTCGLNYHHLTATTPIVAGETWTFDKVVLGKEGSLCVPEGTTLVLPNGFKSVEGDGRLCGILYAGGTIVCGDGDAVHTLQKNWTFHANEPFTFDRDVVVKDGAAIGQLRFYNNATTLSQCNVKVQGKLTVESTGYLWAHMTSMVNSGNFESDFVSRPAGTYCHAGLVGAYSLDVAGNTFGLANATYGSIFNPSLGGTHGVGNDGAMQAQGGGLLILEVTDELKLDGLCDATGGTYYEETGASKGSGGSINITAKKLTGEGAITANGAENMATAEENLLAKFFPRTSNSTRGLNTCTGGGRIAVKLTGVGETFSDYWREHITAHGWSTGIVSGKPGGEISKYAMSSAGTVYLETKSDGAKGGEILVRNDGHVENDLTVTPIPAQTLGDDADSFKCKAALTLADCGRVMLTENLVRMGRLTMAEGSVIDLNGKNLVVSAAKLGAARLNPGTYRASDTVVAGFIADSKGTDGTLVVSGGGYAVIIR